MKCVLGSLPTGEGHPAASLRVGQQRIEGRHDRVDLLGPIHDQPRLSVEDRFGRPTAVTGDLRHPGGGRLEEHDAESLLLEPGPAVPAEHRVDVAAAVEAREVVVAHAPDHPDGRAGGLDEPVEPRAVAAAAADGDGQVGMAGLRAPRRP